MLSVEEAKSRILGAVAPLGTEEVEIASALNRFAASDFISPIDLPPFDNSAMDGYAVQSADLKKASTEKPVSLRMIGKIGAGECSESRVEFNTCIRIFTGSALPAGADAVVMQEDTKADEEQIIFTEPARPFENVRLRGEDIRKGAVILNGGGRVSPTRRALLSACGVARIAVSKQVRAGLVATGNELREPGEAIRSGEIYESNRSLISGFLDEIAAVGMFPIVRDDLEKTRETLEQAFSRCDVVISSGGVSVGEFDFVKDAFAELGGKIELWKIAVRPGKPFVFGRLGQKFLFGLPGNPVSALVTFLILVRPALLKMSGASEIELPRVEGELVDDLVNDGERRHFMRVHWDGRKIQRAGTQASHMIGPLGNANGLVDVPPQTQLRRGEKAVVQLWELPESHES